MSLALLFHYLMLNMFRMLMLQPAPTHIEPEQYRGGGVFLGETAQHTKRDENRETGGGRL